jgi:putative flippase GtrA
MVRLVAGAYDRVRHLVPELAKFGVVGGIGAVIDLGGTAVLHSSYHEGPLKAKAIAVGVATAVTYLGSRYWTFRHRENQPLLREGVLFVVLNVVGLLIAEAVIACTTYVFGLNDPIAYNMASLVGTGLGTIFRYFAYRKWVFLAPAAEPAQAVQPEPALAMEAAAFPAWEPDWDQLPWAPDPTPVYSTVPMRESGQVRLPNADIPNGTVAPHLVTADASGWSAASQRAVTQPLPAGVRGPGRHRKTP